MRSRWPSPAVSAASLLPPRPRDPSAHQRGMPMAVPGSTVWATWILGAGFLDPGVQLAPERGQAVAGWPLSRSPAVRAGGPAASSQVKLEEGPVGLAVASLARSPEWPSDGPASPDPGRMEGVLGEAQKPLHLTSAFVLLTCEKCTTKGTPAQPETQAPSRAARSGRGLFLQLACPPHSAPSPGRPWRQRSSMKDGFRQRDSVRQAGHFPSRVSGFSGLCPTPCGSAPCSQVPAGRQGSLCLWRSSSPSSQSLWSSRSLIPDPSAPCPMSARPPQSCSAPELLALHPRGVVSIRNPSVSPAGDIVLYAKAVGSTPVRAHARISQGCSSTWDGRLMSVSQINRDKPSCKVLQESRSSEHAATAREEMHLVG